MVPTLAFLEAAARAIFIADAGPPATHFLVEAPPTAVFDTPFNIDVTALDADDEIAASYDGTIIWTSSDSGATLPDPSTLTSGQGTFSASMVTLGFQTITATDLADSAITGTSDPIDVDF